MYLEHANISVKDLEEAMRFFSAAFPDFRIRGRGRTETPGNERDWIHFGNDSTYIALEEATGNKSDHETYRNPGINHIGFVVENIEEVISRLAKENFRENMRDFSNPFRKRTYYYDTAGNEFEFVEYLSEKPQERNQY